MRKRALWAAIAVGALLGLVVWSGCGSDNTAQQQAQDMADQLQNVANSTAADNLNGLVEQLKNLEMSVEIIQNGRSSGIWTQKNGSWRLDEPDSSGSYQTGTSTGNSQTSTAESSSSSGSYIIYNAGEQKTWVVSNGSALESSGAQNTSYGAFNPALILGPLAYLPRTGGSGDTLEFGLPGQGKLTIELKGPQGLPSRMVSEDPTGQQDVTEFKYANFGSVDSSLFELPSNIRVQPIDTSGTTGITVPDGSPGS